MATGVPAVTAGPSVQAVPAVRALGGLGDGVSLPGGRGGNSGTGGRGGLISGTSGVPVVWVAWWHQRIAAAKRRQRHQRQIRPRQVTVRGGAPAHSVKWYRVAKAAPVAAPAPAALNVAQVAPEAPVVWRHRWARRFRWGGRRTVPHRRQWRQRRRRQQVRQSGRSGRRGGHRRDRRLTAEPPAPPGRRAARPTATVATAGRGMTRLAQRRAPQVVTAATAAATGRRSATPVPATDGSNSAPVTRRLGSRGSNGGDGSARAIFMAPGVPPADAAVPAVPVNGVAGQTGAGFATTPADAGNAGRQWWGRDASAVTGSASGLEVSAEPVATVVPAVREARRRGRRGHQGNQQHQRQQKRQWRRQQQRCRQDASRRSPAGREPTAMAAPAGVVVWQGRW